MRNIFFPHYLSGEPKNKRPIATLTFHIREVAYKKTHCITDFQLIQKLHWKNKKNIMKDT